MYRAGSDPQQHNVIPKQVFSVGKHYASFMQYDLSLEAFELKFA